MLSLIIGGARSGKSKYAQENALKISKNPIYIATASKNNDPDFLERIIKHQKDRTENWVNYEKNSDLYLLPLQNKTIVIDCVTLWLTSIFFSNNKNIDLSLEKIKYEINELIKIENTNIFIVSNELGMSLHADTDVGRKFTDLQGWTNQYIASKANSVTLMVAGLPLKIK